MYTQAIDNRTDWYVARMTYKGRFIVEFGKTRDEAIELVLLRITPSWASMVL